MAAMRQVPGAGARSKASDLASLARASSGYVHAATQCPRVRADYAVTCSC
jgi:hypothetical protein